jgi:hypothetical protein
VRRLGIVAAVLALLLAGGLLLAAIRSSGTSSSGREGIVKAAPAIDTASPAAVDIAGARQAAINAVALTDEVVKAGFISRRDLISGFATSELAPRLADDTGKQVSALLVELGDRGADVSALRLLEQPLSARATVTGAGVQVDVWSLLVIAAPGTGPARQAWRTVSLAMVLVEGRWLVSGWQSRPGPTPAPAAEASFDDASTISEALGWEPAMDSGGVH